MTSNGGDRTYMGFPVSVDPRVHFKGKSATEVLEELKMRKTVAAPDERLFAEYLDSIDDIADLRNDFLFPRDSNSNNVVYFVGNSLGLQPRGCSAIVNDELRSWSERGVNGHFEGERPWMPYDRFVLAEQARIVGALDTTEVAVMNSLTVNLHLLLIRFYKPTSSRFKIITEGKSFPSDFYALQSQTRLRGFDPKDALIELNPREGEFTLQIEDILDALKEHGDSVAVVALSALQFYTGQYFDVKRITDATHAIGAFSVWDCAHAVGNVDLRLHDWNVDGACWCTYKYLNSGPGGVGGFFIHKKHHNESYLESDRLLGWWSHDEKTRFEMDNVFSPGEGALGYRISNVPILSTASLLSSLQVFGKTSMWQLRSKSMLLTALMESLLRELVVENKEEFQIITSSNEYERGAQLSLLFKCGSQVAKNVLGYLEERGVMVDYRNPGLLRAAPAPLYCRFVDVVKFRDILRECIYINRH